MRYDEAKLAEYFSQAPEDVSLADIDMARIPGHVSIIMDGNGRWAQARGLDRSRGHVAGVDSLREAVTTSVRLGLDVLSVYAFSTENWKRPQEEVNMLMHLFATTLLHELPLFHQENVRLRFFGDLEALPEETRKVFQQGLDETAANTGMTFVIAVNYGGRDEITRAVRHMMMDCQDGKLEPENVTEQTVASYLDTAGIPDPDLLIRTSGEIRLSNYLLWQLAYSEIYITDCLWPDFNRDELIKAIEQFNQRDRRFGGVKA